MFYREVAVEKWDMPHPKVVLSLIGTVEDELIGQYSYEMLRGLLTPLNHALLLTSGTQQGVDKEIAGKTLKWVKERRALTADSGDQKANLFGIGINAKCLVKDGADMMGESNM